MEPEKGSELLNSWPRQGKATIRNITIRDDRGNMDNLKLQISLLKQMIEKTWSHKGFLNPSSIVKNHSKNI